MPPEATDAYALVVRLVDEHCVLVVDPQGAVEGDADADLAPVPVVPQEAKLLTGDLLQTPHDPEVTYSGHKGQGYAVLLAETYAPENAVQLLTHFSVDRACDGDADRVAPTLTALAAREILPETLLADTAFGSVENVAACAQQGVELIAPQPGKAGAVVAAETATVCVRDTDFTIQLVPSQPPSRCPCGVTALQTVLRDDSVAGPMALFLMPTASCAACPRRGWCPALLLENGDTLVMIALTENLPAHRREVEQTATFQDAYRPRAGIEGTNSELKRGHGLGTLRVRGGRRVEMAVGFRVMACNFKRMLAYLVNTRRKANKEARLSCVTRVFARKSLWRAWEPLYIVCQAVA